MAKFRSCECSRLHESPTFTYFMKCPEGTFFWWQEDQKDGSTITHLNILMPYFEGHDKGKSLHMLRVFKGEEKDIPSELVDDIAPIWAWDGDENKPTLSPSIRCGPDGHPLWHGHLIKGHLKASAG